MTLLTKAQAAKAAHYNTNFIRHRLNIGGRQLISDITRMTFC